jgi:pimeloyl-ACP methyl ester carboxylesterase
VSVAAARLSAADIRVDGRRVRYWTSQERERRLVLLHGASAHAMWWSQVVPLLAPDFQCVAIDNSGHGDSERAASYSNRMWLDEIDAVCDEVGIQHPDLVGHSRGGRLAILAAAVPDARARGIVLLDSSIRPPHLHRPPSVPLDRPQRTYATYAEARARFRLLPEQTPPTDAVLDGVAAYSIRRFGDRWGWKYDAAVPLNIDDAAVEEAMPRVRVPAAMAYGGRSVVVTEEMAEHTRAHLPVVVSERLRDAEHHLVLTHPRETAAFIVRAIACFDALDAAGPQAP